MKLVTYLFSYLTESSIEMLHHSIDAVSENEAKRMFALLTEKDHNQPSAVVIRKF